MPPLAISRQVTLYGRLLCHFVRLQSPSVRLRVRLNLVKAIAPESRKKSEPKLTQIFPAVGTQTD